METTRWQTPCLEQQTFRIIEERSFIYVSKSSCSTLVDSKMPRNSTSICKSGWFIRSGPLRKKKKKQQAFTFKSQNSFPCHLCQQATHLMCETHWHLWRFWPNIVLSAVSIKASSSYRRKSLQTFKYAHQTKSLILLHYKAEDNRIPSSPAGQLSHEPC